MLLSPLYCCGWISAVDMLNKLMGLDPVKVIQSLTELFLNESIQAFCGKALDARNTSDTVLLFRRDGLFLGNVLVSIAIIISP
jgi:hypothetical protein